MNTCTGIVKYGYTGWKWILAPSLADVEHPKLEFLNDLAMKVRYG